MFTDAVSGLADNVMSTSICQNEYIKVAGNLVTQKLIAFAEFR